MSQPKKSLYDFCTENKNKKHLLREWDYGKNKELNINPQDIGKGSNKKVWWKCPKGHTYDMSVSDRTEGHNCPICSGSRLVIGANDLLSQYPDVCKDWDYKKNNKKPEEYFHHSSKKVFWRCHKCGHRWETQISKRTNKKHPTGCPRCINHGMSRAEMCIYLAIKQSIPDTEYRKKIDGIEFDIYIPSENFAIEYDGIYWHDKTKEKSEKKKDVKAKEKGIRFLRIKETLNPKYSFSLENDVLYIDIKYNIKYKTICKYTLSLLRNIYGLNIETQVNDTIIQEAIAQINTINYKNSLAAKFPKVVKEWHPTKNGSLTPDKINAYSHCSVWWKCSNCGNEYRKEVHRKTDKRYLNEGKCKYCTGQARKKGYNDLETLYPGIIKYWDFEKNKEEGINFYKVAPKSTKYAHWKFPEGEQYMQIRSAIMKYEKINN